MDIDTLSRAGEVDPGNVTGSEETISNQAAPREKLSLQELETLRPVIKELYIDKGLTFQEVQAILHTQYNYKPTYKQFADLRRQWNMKKNTSRTDRQIILAKLATNEVSEEGSIGTVNLNKEKVNKWRAEAINIGASGRSSTSRVKNHTARPRRPLDRYPKSDANRRELLPRSVMLRQPGSPRDFRMTEGLLFSINSYITGMYDQGAWLAPSGGQSKNFSQEKQQKSHEVSNKFSGSGVSALELIKANSFIEARRVLSNACGLVKEVLLSTYPLTLGQILWMFYNMKKGGLAPLDDALDLLREYMGRMAEIVLPNSHPWRVICCLLGSVDRNKFLHIVSLAMRALADALEKQLGSYAPDALQTRVRYIFYHYSDKLRDGERLLLGLLAGCPDPAVSAEETFTILGALGGVLREQGRFEEYLAIGKEYSSKAQSYGDTNEVINGLRITAMGYHSVGNQELAEASQRAAVNLLREDELSLPWAINSLSQLESWVRGWGREEDADKIKAEIEDLIKRDTAEVEGSTA